MNFQDAYFRFLGLAAVLLAGALLVHMTLSIPDDPATVAHLASLWPWAASHLQGILWTVAAVILVVTMLIPLKLTFAHVDREGTVEGSPLARLGLGVSLLCAAITVFRVGRGAFHFLASHWH